MYFVEPFYIYEMNKTDIEIYKQNIKKVFDGFYNFLKLVENKRKININEWLGKMDQQGGNAVIKLLTWVVWFKHYQEGFIFLKPKINSIFKLFSDFLFFQKYKFYKKGIYWKLGRLS